MPRITRRDISRFTMGDCHILARAVNKLTGWPIYTFGSKVSGAPQDHCFVIDPDGFARDVEGVHTMEEFCDRWYKHEHWIEWDWEELTQGYRKFWGGTHYRKPNDKYSYKRARQLAPLIAEMEPPCSN